MRNVQTFRGKVRDGQVRFNDRRSFDGFVRGLDGQEIEIRVCRLRTQRTLSQNAWYHGCIVPMLAEYCGYERDEMHEALKHKFLKQVDEHGFETTRSTRDLTTAEFTEYAEQCRRLAAQLGVVIPDPGQVE